MRPEEAQPREPGEAWWKPVVSRAAMLIAGLVLLFGAWRCADLARTVTGEYRQMGVSGSRASGNMSVFWIAAGVMAVLGGALTIGALMPTRFMEMLAHQLMSED